MKKELNSKTMNIKIKPSFYDRFYKYCQLEYKGVSEVVKDLMIEYVKAKDKEYKSENK